MLTEYFSGGIVVSCPLPKYAVTLPLSSAASGSTFHILAFYNNPFNPIMNSANACPA